MGVLVWSVTSLLILLVSSATSKDDNKCSSCVHKSSVYVFPEHEHLSKGTCKYGNDETEVGNVQLAAATSTLYSGGIGCGAFYQVKCTDTRICKQDGIVVIVFSEHVSANSNPAFRLGEKAFKGMFLTGHGTNLKSIGVLYKRVRSVFVEKKNRRPPSLSVRIEEKTNDSMAIKILYQGGQTDLVMIEVKAEPQNGGQRNWTSFKRKNGAIWKVNSLPTATNQPLKFKFSVRQWYKTVSYESKTLNVPKVGSGFDLGFQFNETASESCNSCVHTW